MRRWSLARPALVAILLAACAGSSAVERAPERGSATTAEADDPPSAGEAGEAGEPEPSRADVCADGTCFRCGAGFCMTGFFCDEGAAGGAACSWLPSCP